MHGLKWPINSARIVSPVSAMRASRRRTCSQKAAATSRSSSSTASAVNVFTGGHELAPQLRAKWMPARRSQSALACPHQAPAAHSVDSYMNSKSVGCLRLWDDSCGRHNRRGSQRRRVRASMGLMSRAQRGSPATKGLEKRPGPVLQKRAHSVGQCEPTLGILIHEHRANERGASRLWCCRAGGRSRVHPS